MTDVDTPVLVRPPAAVVGACCAGLAARDRTQVGGTARSVPFAARVCRGEPVTLADVAQMVQHFDLIEEAMLTRGLADQALAVAWELWGGDPGREWAEGFVRPVTAAPAPAPAAVDPAPPGWVAALNQLAVVERELLARVHEVIETGVTVALARIQARVVNALTRPSAELKARLGGFSQRDTVLAGIRAAATPEAAVGGLTSGLRAALGPTITDEDTLRAVFGEHITPRVAELVARHQQHVTRAVVAAGVSQMDTDELAVQFQVSLDTAVGWLTGTLLQFCAAVLTGRDPYGPAGEAPAAGRVPASIPWMLLGIAGGGDPDNPAEQDYVRGPDGTLLCSGVALGGTVLRLVTRANTRGGLSAAPGPLAAATITARLVLPRLAVTTRTTWRWGGSARPFPAHQRLDGESWGTEQERVEVCRNRDSFPAGDVYTPGDHQGCSCSLQTTLTVRPADDAADTERLSPRSPARAVTAGVAAVTGVSGLGAVARTSVVGPRGPVPVELHRAGVTVPDPMIPGAGRLLWPAGSSDQILAGLAGWLQTAGAAGLVGVLDRLLVVPKDQPAARPVSVAVVRDGGDWDTVRAVGAGSQADLLVGYLAAGIAPPAWLLTALGLTAPDLDQ